MNPSAPHPHRRRLTRAEVRRRRRSRAIRRVAGLTVMLCVAVGGVSFLLTRRAVVPSASAASAISMPAQSIADSTVSSAENTAAPANALGLTADEARAMLADPLMVLVNHTSKMPDDYTFDTKECGSATAVNKTLQTAACDAFLEMQKAAAADGVTVWMQSGYRSVKYQTSLYERKTKYYLDKGYDNATAKEKAAAVVNPPGYSEHNCGLAADLNSPEHTGLDEGFEKTAAFRWLCEHAGDYGFILRYPKDAEDKTEIIYEPWHWRYVGVDTRATMASSSATRRTPRTRRRSSTNPGTGDMWAWRTPLRSTPAACALRSISRLCRASPPRSESTGEEKVKISRFVCNSAVDMVDYLGVSGRQFSGRPGLRILTTKEGNLL